MPVVVLIYLIYLTLLYPESTKPRISTMNTTADHSAISSLGYPPSLVRACTKEGAYAVALPSVGVLTFGYAEAVGTDWVRLHDIEPQGEPKLNPLGGCEAGLDVRVSSIIWAQECV